MSTIFGLMIAVSGIGLGIRPAMAQDAPPATSDKVAVLNGTVLSSVDDAPIPNARVQIRDQSETAGADGKFTFRLSRSGPVAVRVSAEGFRQRVETVVLSFTDPKSLTFRLQPKVEDPNDDEDENDAEVEVKVVDKSTGRSVSGAVVKLGDLEQNTDRDGEAEFEDLAAGALTLRVTAEGYQPFEQSLTLAEDQELKVRVELQKTGETSPPPVIETGTVSGTVKDSLTNAPLPGAFVRIGSIVQNTGPNGEFSFQGVQVGEVEVIVKANGYLPAVQRLTVTKDATATADFTLAKRPQPRPATGNIQGIIVTDEEGTPVPNATVRLGDREPVKTDATGEFSFTDVRPGQTAIQVTAEGFEEETVKLKVHPGQTTNVSVELESETETPAPIQIGTLSGKVTSCPETAFGEDGTPNPELCTEPVIGAVVKFGNWKVTTDESGSYNLSGLPVGTLKVEIHKSGFQSAERTVEIKPDDVTLLNVVLFAKERKDKEEREPRVGQGTITGTVQDEAGNPVEGAVVMLRGVRKVTDGTGRFEFTQLPFGNYNVQVWAKNSRHTHKKVSVENADPVNVDITLVARKSAEETHKGGDEKVGDVDEDDRVTVIDAIAALRAALGLEDLTVDALKKARMDVAPAKPGGDFGDGTIDIKDAIKLLKFIARLDLVLP
ncbi:MAG: carboxypeptidase regulatory-like domain-containing protein [Armatimonadetes bacterium]|nr:carboxypeptidase regulatory-like domain-containing protein [Armatimonadota bacterium]